jgi:acyl-CoA thioester hydrolase
MNEVARFDTPIIGPTIIVDARWIGAAGLMQSAFYGALFDRSMAEALEILDLGERHLAANKAALMAAETHISYVRGLKEGDGVRVTFRLIDADDRRLHVYQEIYHLDGWLAAAAESVHLNLDLQGNRVVSMPEMAFADAMTMLRYHRSLPRTKYMGRIRGLN